MTNANEVKRLASLVRISIPDESLNSLVKEFDSILAYIGQLDSLKLSTDGVPVIPLLHNVFRDDDKPVEPYTNTQKLIDAFPRKEGDALLVKQILKHD